MKNLTLLSLLLAACTGGERADTGQCPAGETCSSKTPHGLHFVGREAVGALNLGTPLPTAVGGTQEIDLFYDKDGTGNLVPLDLPYTADDDSGFYVQLVGTQGSTVTIGAAGTGSNYLRILDATDGTLFDRKEMSGAALQSLALVPGELQNTPDGVPLAWAPGDRTIGIGLFGQIQSSTGPVTSRLVDGQMSIAAPGAARVAWDTLHVPDAQVGTSPVTVTAAGMPTATLDLVVTSTADSVQPWIMPSSIPPAGSTNVCFEALFGGRFVLDLAWTYTVDGATITTHGDPCFNVQTTKTSGTVTVQATAGGATTSAQLAVGTSHARVPAQTRYLGTTAGERAAM